MNIPYYEQKGEDRYGAGSVAGDIAESAVSRVCDEQLNRPVVRFGPARVDTARAQQTTWHPLVRYAPDYLQFGRFIECQGTAGEYIIFKRNKLEALITWNAWMPVWFGIYNSQTDEVIFADLSSVLWAIHHPDAKPLVLDGDTKAPKEAWKVPIVVLLEVRYHNAFEAERIEQGKRKR